MISNRIWTTWPTVCATSKTDPSAKIIRGIPSALIRWRKGNVLLASCQEGLPIRPQPITVCFFQHGRGLTNCKFFPRLASSRIGKVESGLGTDDPSVDT